MGCFDELLKTAQFLSVSVLLVDSRWRFGQRKCNRIASIWIFFRANATRKLAIRPFYSRPPSYADSIDPYVLTVFMTNSPVRMVPFASMETASDHRIEAASHEK
jgi:hypothetical protein